MPSGTPAPESWTLNTSSSRCSVTETLTHRSFDDAAASRALSIRLPSSVMRSSLSTLLRVMTVSSLTRSSMPRSDATAAFASSNAPRTGSPTRSISDSVSSWCRPDVWAISFIASSARPTCIRPAMVWSRFANSWACARSASVRLSTPRPRARPVSSVVSRRVATWPIVWPRTTIARRLATSTRSPASKTSSSSFSPPDRNFNSRPCGRTWATFRPTQSGGSERRRRASRGNAERASLHAHPGLARQDRSRVLVHRLADERRVRVGVSNSSGVGDDDVARAGGVADPLRRLLDHRVRIAVEEPLLDRRVLSDRLGDRQRALLRLAVQLLTRLPDGGRGADQGRDQDDRDLEAQDLVGEWQTGLQGLVYRS